MASMVLAAHLGALVCTGLIEIVDWLRYPLGVLVIASLVWQWRRSFWWRGGDLKISDEGLCTIQGGEPLTAKIVRADVFAGFIRLRIALVSGRSRTLLLMQDALAPESYRELCARIRQGRLPVSVQAAMREPL